MNMNVYLEIQLDTCNALEREKSIAAWFDDAYRRLFTALHADDVADMGVWTSSLARREDDPMTYYGTPDALISVLTRLGNPPYWAQLSCESGETEVSRARVAHPMSDGSHSIASAAVDWRDEMLARPNVCALLVDFLAQVAGEANPAFGRIEYRQFSDRSNLDVALRRKPRQFLPESRRLLRGYAWTTILPEELVARLGGVKRLVASEAFFRVVALPAGGALVQATPTLSDYADPEMEKVFCALAPVLPAGTPKSHPAFPGVRFVPTDAASV
jgi:hypothetical protein